MYLSSSLSYYCVVLTTGTDGPMYEILCLSYDATVVMMHSLFLIVPAENHFLLPFTVLLLSEDF